MAALLTPISAQTDRADLSAIFLRDAPPPLMAATPPPPGSAFIAINTAAFDHTDPAAITDVRIERFPLGPERNVTLLLRRFDVMEPTGVAVIGRSSGDVPFALEKHLIFSGSVDGIAGSYVYLAIFRGFAVGYIDLPAPGDISQRYIIAPDNTDTLLPATTIVCDARALPPSDRGHIDCTTESMPDYQERVDKVFRDINDRFNLKIDSRDREQLASKTLAVQIAVECDISYFRMRNYNLSQAANYALIVLGASSAIYRRDVNVVLQVPYLRIWTEAGPYPGPGQTDLLTQLQRHWIMNMREIQRDVTIMFTIGGGGVAFQDATCNGNGIAVMGLESGTNFPDIGYLWETDVTSHELGHSFGSPHTHSCSWAPPIDSCYRAEGDCFSEVIYDRSGSIMSYCHTTIARTQLYFHPKVATLIRSSLELKPCITPVDATLDSDIAMVQILSPANGGSLAAGKSIVPSVIVRNVGTRTQAAIPVTLTVERPAAPETLYTSSRAIPLLGPGASTPVTFDTLTISTDGYYMVKASANPAGDQQRANNTMRRPFQIVKSPAAAAILLLSPNGGRSYAAGTDVQIRWNAAADQEVTLQFSADDGITWMPIRYRQPAVPGTLGWTIPAIPTTKGRVRINSLNDASIADISDTTFTITVGRDMQSLGLIDPIANTTVGLPLAPKAEFRNNGTETLSDVPVRLRMIRRSDGAEVYNDTTVIGRIMPGASMIIGFSATSSLRDGEHVVVARALLDADQAPSNDSVGRTISIAGLAVPVSLTTYPMSRAVLLSWRPLVSDTITGYRIYRGTSPEALTLLATMRPTVLSAADTSLNDGTQYFYSVRAIDGSGRVLASPAVAATPMTYRAGFPLNHPALLLPALATPDIPAPTNFTWLDVPGAEIYQLQIATDRDMSDIVFNQFTQKPGAQIPTEFEHTYYWRVRAFNYSSTGPWTAGWQLSTAANCAGGALALDGATTRMDASGFAWSDSAVTVEYWNYVASPDVSNGMTLGIGGEEETDRFMISSPDGERMLVWDYGDATIDGRISADYTPYLDKWTHVALVSDGGNYKAIFINGTLVASGSEADHPAPRAGLRIGASLNGYHKGMIDELRIWNRVRTGEEILQDMHRLIAAPQTGLVGYWRFDEGSGTAAADLSASHAHGTLTGGTPWRTSGTSLNCPPVRSIAAPTPMVPADGDLFGALYAPTFIWDRPQFASVYHLQVMESDGRTDPKWDIANIIGGSYTLAGLRPGTTYFWRIRGRNSEGDGPWSAMYRFTTADPCRNSTLRFNGDSSIVSIDSFALDGRAATVEFWNYVDSVHRQFLSTFSVGRTDRIENRMNGHVPWDDGNIYWDYGNINTTGRLTASYTGYTNKWTHVALVSNGVDAMRIYLDGNLAAGSSAADFPRDLSRLTIGGIPGMFYHNGMIDEFRVWNTPRTQQQIRADMYRKLSGPQSGLVGYWSMDEGSGIVTHDSSGFAHDGTLAGGPVWETTTLRASAAPEPISGPAVAIRGAADTTYSVTPGPGEHYSWNVIGGRIAAGQGTNSIDVAWGEGNEGIVALRTDRDAGCADSVEMRLDIVTLLGVENGEAIADLAFTSTPNPFNASTTISYRLTRPQHVSLAIYSLDGALVERLVDGPQQAGEHRAVFNGQGLPSGIYICRVGAGDRYRYVKALHLVR